MIIYANPSSVPTGLRKKKKATPATPARKGRKKGAGTMAKHRTAAQKAATAKLLRWNKSHRRKTTRNPSSSPRKATRRSGGTSKRRTYRNPSSGGFFGGGGVLGELLSKDGLLMIGGAFVAPMAADFIQEKIMPSATGWTKILVKAAIIGAGAWAIDKFGRQRKAAVAFGVTGGAVLAADAIRLYRGQMAGLSEGEADYLATRPELMQAYVNAGSGMGDPWAVGLGDPYKVGLADAWSPAFG